MKIDYGNTSDVKKPNLRDKNIIISIESLATFGKGHAGGKQLTAVLNLAKPISKKSWKKHTRSIAQSKKSLREIYTKNAALAPKMYFKNTGSITVDPLADREKQNIEIAVSVDGSWDSHGWTSQNGIVDVF